uniref:Ketoreductase domain-containing protein n=1 Tax=Araucaria cunninghamii TaxID=56994 RepID=A0A0D6R7P8_ARACU
MFGFIVFSLTMCTIIWWIVRFALADADFTLLSKGPPKQGEFEDKVVWITGASQGIGEALGKEFARLGAKLILSARREAELERVKAGLSGKNAPNGVMILPLDLTAGARAIEEAVRKAESFFNGAGVDYMVHNAAHERPKTSVLETSEEALQDTFNVNVLGTITLTRHLAPFMLKRGRGHFVVMSSAAGKTPAPGQAIYSASKHAVNGYFHTLRSELAQKGIKVTVVCPGPIETSTSPSSANTKMQKPVSEKRVSVTRCVELTVIATTHGLKEVWISKQPVLAVMYVMQYIPTLGHHLMEKIGPRRLETVKEGGNAYGLHLVFGRNKKHV